MFSRKTQHTKTHTHTTIKTNHRRQGSIRLVNARTDRVPQRDHPIQIANVQIWGKDWPERDEINRSGRRHFHGQALWVLTQQCVCVWKCVEVCGV